MSAELPLENLSREDVIREIARLAALDTRRGIGYWFDGELTDALRELALGGSAPVARSGASTPAPPAASPDVVPAPLTSAPTARPAGPTPRSRPGVGGTGATSASAGGPGVSSTPAPPESAARSAKIPTWGAPPLAVGRATDWSERLALLGEAAAACTRCQLCESRNKVVFGVGSAAVSLVFVGEAPGADEDRLGYPFVGRAGQLLDKIIRAIGLERDEVYICNVLKCRPPGNRNPAPEEIAKCTPFLEEQLAILKPKIICTLGLFASQYLLQSQLPIGKLRGRILDYRGTPVVPTYHPAALLRNPKLKAAVWDDVQLVRRTLDS